jgi:hypothetical protein
MNYLIAALISIFTATAHASDASRSSRFFFSIAAKAGTGASASEDEVFAESRDHFHYGAEASLGMRFGYLVTGLTIDYLKWSQRTDPEEVDDTNMSGTQLNLSPILGLNLGPFILLGRPVLYSQLRPDQKNFADEKVSYESPEFGSYVVQLNYKLAGRSYIGLEYTNVTYEDTVTGSDESKLDDKITYAGWGLIYGFVF